VNASVVRYEHRGPVAWVTIDRPEARNALSADVRAGLFAAAERFRADADAAVLVLTGAGDRAFCAGGDLKEMAEVALRVPPPDFLPVFGRNVVVEKPTIAAVNGVAFAGGFLLAQMCDLCVAADHVEFAITEARVGRGAPWAMPLPWLVPPRIAMELLLTAQPISAARAYDIGLVNRVVPYAELHDTVQVMAETIAANAPLSVAAGREMVYRAARGRSEAEYAVADALWEPVYLSDDAQEGPRAFREKRAPRWTGS
jgi:enoyl-CoA hydratase/carnithine racemase